MNSKMTKSQEIYYPQSCFGQKACFLDYSPTITVDDLITFWCNNEIADDSFDMSLDDFLISETFSSSEPQNKYNQKSVLGHTIQYQHPPSISPRHEPSFVAEGISTPDRDAQIVYPYLQSVSPRAFESTEIEIPKEIFFHNIPESSITYSGEEDSRDWLFQQVLCSALSQHNFVAPKLCPTCDYKFKTPASRGNFLKHAREKHPNNFAFSQWHRIQYGEIPVPRGIHVGLYMLNMLMFMADITAKVPDVCFVPGCVRTGRDRNIMTGHFRGAHRKTYTYCQEVLKCWDTSDLVHAVEKLDASGMIDSHATRRKYSYKHHQQQLKRQVLDSSSWINCKDDDDEDGVEYDSVEEEEMPCQEFFMNEHSHAIHFPSPNSHQQQYIYQNEEPIYFQDGTTFGLTTDIDILL
jgi:hypothetical protein